MDVPVFLNPRAPRAPQAAADGNEEEGLLPSGDLWGTTPQISMGMWLHRLVSTVPAE